MLVLSEFDGNNYLSIGRQIRDGIDEKFTKYFEEEVLTLDLTTTLTNYETLDSIFRNYLIGHHN